MIRLWKLHSFRVWWRTRKCDHVDTERQVLIEMGMRKMFWCDRCQRTWFN